MKLATKTKDERRLRPMKILIKPLHATDLSLRRPQAPHPVSQPPLLELPGSRQRLEVLFSSECQMGYFELDNGAFERLVDKPSATSKMINDRPVGSNVRRFHRDALEKAVQIASTPWN
ncbi:ER-Golgi SNARE complex subunit [Aspergillus luchuensis]|uniref:ER-Golgi SNARE complex subunit n=1 Tax=Aspergillus kawachii TaxID=1069201 RepID=A0A146F0X0_ASPKA|nr:ER-Golgi SNARE complex subunit [Aspergillus luchuensis]